MTDSPPEPDKAFPEIAPAAREAAGAAQGRGSSNSPAPPKAKREVYLDQYELSEEAHRSFRRWAFYAVGVASLAYLVMLPIAIFFVVDDNSLAILASARGAGWHVILLTGLVLVILAAVPLSLTLALVRMISSGKQDNDEGNRNPGITTPQIELVKAMLDMVKAAK
ncbi:hypothetical protein C9397_14400 [Xanthomonas vasicola pv. vasculorum]|uniref:Uncharacterized protein n=1 Tax=Xanthomonas vasicola TaxID=56459 RepID=A0ABD7SE13_XANVA|nr:hypothetical protein [Xanthomonas vasicola]AZR24411.1 hypothetical protein NX81_021505 [Xanthomonas vasicola]MBV7304194.1 hypothetical protein [Xanthomonas vasicola pv. vasculorum]MDO6934542.1 hypothetical protein [Xanthomonas vasicola]MDO6938205.1 hypothetical protein [Xanthomonas vasicola]MDO6972897.1 hypothetical protein [Xanthomonas vasicola]